MFNPPAELVADIEIPDRSGMKTIGDMVRIILADEEVMQVKNVELKALRSYIEKVQEIGETK